MSDLLAKCLLSVPTTSCSGSPEVLVPEGGILPTGDIVLSLNWKLRLATLVVQWLRLHTPNAGGLGSTPGRGTRAHVPHMSSYVAAEDPHAAQLRHGVVK